MRLFLTMITLLFSGTLYAQGCWPLLAAEAEQINRRDGHTQYVGGQFYVTPVGGIGYWQGLEVPADIDNWAEDLQDAIKWGPFASYYGRGEDPRREILALLSDEIKDDCSLSMDEDYTRLRSILKELMDQGAFCSAQAMLERPWHGRWKNYRRVLRDAVRGGQFQAQCQSVAVSDDHAREAKDAVESGAGVPSDSEANQQ